MGGRVSSGLIRFLTLAALALSIVGLYAVTAHSVNQRAPELGVRIALGARPRALRQLVVGHALWQVALGLVLGVLGTLAWDAVFFSGRVDRRFASPEIVAPVALVLIVVTLLACVIPIRRATRLDPIAVLREE